MVQISAVGLKNEYWRRRLFLSDSTPPRYARIRLTEAAHRHPKMVEAVFRLLSCPAQMDEEFNPNGDCDLLRLVLDGETFLLKVDCFAYQGDSKISSDDPTDDEKTTRIYTCMLAWER